MSPTEQRYTIRKQSLSELNDHKEQLDLKDCRGVNIPHVCFSQVWKKFNDVACFYLCCAQMNVLNTIGSQLPSKTVSHDTELIKYN